MDRESSLRGSLKRGTAHHKMILNNAGTPFDYVFLDVDKGFEAIIGLKKEMVVNRRVTEILPGIVNPHFDWIGFYSQVANGEGPKRFIQSFKPLGKWFSITAFSCTKGCFSTVFYDITPLKVMVEKLRLVLSLIQEDPSPIMERKVSQKLASLTGAKIVLFITYQLEEKKVLIRSVVGKKIRIKKIQQFLSFALEGMEFPMLPEKQESLKGLKLVEYKNFYEFSYGFVPRPIAEALDKILSVNRLFSIAIPFHGQLVGEFCLAFTPWKEIAYPSLLELFAQQVGMLMNKVKLHEYPGLKEKEKAKTLEIYRHLLDSSPYPLCILDGKGQTLVANSIFTNLIDGWADKNFPQQRRKGIEICPGGFSLRRKEEELISMKIKEDTYLGFVVEEIPIKNNFSIKEELLKR